LDDIVAQRGCEILSIDHQQHKKIFIYSYTTPNYTRTSWDSFSSPTSYDNTCITYYCATTSFCI